MNRPDVALAPDVFHLARRRAERMRRAARLLAWRRVRAVVRRALRRAGVRPQQAVLARCGV